MHDDVCDNVGDITYTRFMYKTVKLKELPSTAPKKEGWFLAWYSDGEWSMLTGDLAVLLNRASTLTYDNVTWGLYCNGALKLQRHPKVNLAMVA